jgi:uncharacterized repeat protein (TIGR01451 family)
MNRGRTARALVSLVTAVSVLLTGLNGASALAQVAPAPVGDTTTASASIASGESTASGTAPAIAPAIPWPGQSDTAQTTGDLATSFPAGTLIIPMDTDTTGNHALFNQNLGMWKAYGLVYRLLDNGIPVHWAIAEGKTSTSDVDFSVSSVSDRRTGTALGSWSYRGGPFIIDSANVAAAMPIISAWWAARANLPNVHVAATSFSADVNVTLRSPPRIANEATNSGIAIAYYNAAGIPDLNGNPWSSTSPNILDQAEIAGGALFKTGSTCLERAFDTFVTPHNGGYSYSLIDPTNLGTRTYAQLDTFVNQGGGWTAMCHSILSNENNIANLTLSGSPAVKALFRTSALGGVPGGLLTTTGFSRISNTGGAWTVTPEGAGLPVGQSVPTTVAPALPGGSVQTWPAPGNPGAPTYYATTERVGYFDTPTVDHDLLIAGTYHNGTGLGKITYIGGHTYSTAVPFSGNNEAPYLRAFYNSLFFNGSAVAKLDLSLSSSSFPQNGSGSLTLSLTNTGGSVATNVSNASIVLKPGFTYLSSVSGPAPVVSGQTLSWPSLGNVAGGSTAVAVQVGVDTSISGTVGRKQIATYHAEYGDVFGESFTANLCRDIEIRPAPGPSLTKTPATQGPVAEGSLVTWTLTYGNPGNADLLGVRLEDTLPTGFVYVSSSSSPSIGSPQVIPGTSTILRWNLGTIPANTAATRTVTITARAGSVTNGTGDPLQQTFTNNARLTGTDSGGASYRADASATVVVRKLAVSLGKTVDIDYLDVLPGTLTYTLRPRSTDTALLENVRVIDPYPTGMTAPPLSISGGGTYGPYVPVAAVPGNDPGPPILDTNITVGSNFVLQGGSVTVTLNVRSSTAQPGVVPTDLTAIGGTATCSAPTPGTRDLAANTFASFTYTCTLHDLGEYIFGGGAENAAESWPTASSASVLSAATGGPNVITWNLGSNLAGIPGEAITSGYTAGVYGFRGATSPTFQKYGATANSWTARANALANVAKGGALTTNGTGTIFGLAGGGTQTFWSYNIATNTWTARANTGVNVDLGGALVYLNVGGTDYIFATMGNGTGFRRYNVATNTWAAMTAAPNNIKAGGALTTDGTNIYVLRGDARTTFWRYNVGANTWTALAVTPASVRWGGSLAQAGNLPYAM